MYALVDVVDGPLPEPDAGEREVVEDRRGVLPEADLDARAAARPARPARASPRSAMAQRPARTNGVASSSQPIPQPEQHDHQRQDADQRARDCRSAAMTARNASTSPKQASRVRRAGGGQGRPNRQRHPERRQRAHARGAEPVALERLVRAEHHLSEPSVAAIEAIERAAGCAPRQVRRASTNSSNRLPTAHGDDRQAERSSAAGQRSSRGARSASTSATAASRPFSRMLPWTGLEVTSHPDDAARSEQPDGHAERRAAASSRPVRGQPHEPRQQRPARRPGQTGRSGRPAAARRAAPRTTAPAASSRSATAPERSPARSASHRGSGRGRPGSAASRRRAGDAGTSRCQRSSMAIVRRRPSSSRVTRSTRAASAPPPGLMRAPAGWRGGAVASHQPEQAPDLVAVAVRGRAEQLVDGRVELGLGERPAQPQHPHHLGMRRRLGVLVGAVEHFAQLLAGARPVTTIGMSIVRAQAAQPDHPPGQIARC